MLMRKGFLSDVVHGEKLSVELTPAFLNFILVITLADRNAFDRRHPLFLKLAGLLLGNIKYLTTRRIMLFCVTVLYYGFRRMSRSISSVA